MACQDKDVEQVPVLTVHASRKRTPPIQRGGRGKRNAGESGMPAGSGSGEAGSDPDCDLDDSPSSTGPSDHSSAVPSDYMDDCYSGFIGLRPARMRKH